MWSISFFSRLAIVKTGNHFSFFHVQRCTILKSIQLSYRMGSSYDQESKVFNAASLLCSLLPEYQCCFFLSELFALTCVNLLGCDNNFSICFLITKWNILLWKNLSIYDNRNLVHVKYMPKSTFNQLTVLMPAIIYNIQRW